MGNILISASFGGRKGAFFPMKSPTNFEEQQNQGQKEAMGNAGLQGELGFPMGIPVLAVGLGQPPQHPAAPLQCCSPQVLGPHFKPGIALGSMGYFRGAATEAGTGEC